MKFENILIPHIDSLKTDLSALLLVPPYQVLVSSRDDLKDILDDLTEIQYEHAIDSLNSLICRLVDIKENLEE